MLVRRHMCFTASFILRPCLAVCFAFLHCAFVERFPTVRFQMCLFRGTCVWLLALYWDHVWQFDWLFSTVHLLNFFLLCVFNVLVQPHMCLTTSFIFETVSCKLCDLTCVHEQCQSNLEITNMCVTASLILRPCPPVSVAACHWKAAFDKQLVKV